MSNSPRRALLWSLAERYANFTVAFGSTLVLARLLTSAEVGIYSVCAAFAMMAALLRDFGVSEYLIQERELTRDKLRSAMGIALVTAWTIGAGVLLLRHVAARFFGEPRVADVLAVTAVHFLILPLSSPAFAMMNREMAFRPLFFVQTACTFTHAATSISLALAGFGPLALAWAPVASVAMQTLILAWLRPQETFVMPTFSAWRPVLQFGVKYMTSRTVENLAEFAHEPIIAKLYGFATLGLFSRALSMVDQFRKNVTDAFVRVATPTFAERHRQGLPVGDALLHATAIFTGLSWPFFSFVALASREILGVMFGSHWVDAAPLASILALAAIPTALWEFVPQMLSATGHVDRRLRIALWGSAIHITAVASAAFWGPAPMAAAFSVSALSVLVIAAFQLRASTGLPLAALGRVAWGSGLFAAACAAAAGLVLWAARSAGWPPLLNLLVSAAALVATWLGAGALLRHPAHGEVRLLWRSVRGRAAAL